LHICFLNKEFVGLGYDFYQPVSTSYGIVTFKLYHCKICGRLFCEDKKYMSDSYESMFNKTVENVKNVGYKPVGLLVENWSSNIICSK